MKISNDTYDAIIIGMGPTGETAANILGHYGLHILAIDQKIDIYPFPRAGALDSDCLRIWGSLGLHSQILPFLNHKQTIQFVDQDNQQLLEYLGEEDSEHLLSMSFFYQPKISSILRNNIARFPHTETHYGWKLLKLTQCSKHVRLILQNTQNGYQKEVKARWLLGCDGASSDTRKLCGISFEGKDLAYPWTVVDAHSEHSLGEQIFRFHCDPKLPRVSTSLVQGYYRWEWSSTYNSLYKEDHSLQKVRNFISNNFCTSPKSASDWEKVNIRRIASYTLQERIADTWQQHRVFLLGDAAHVSLPFAGQGVSNGVRDAFRLCQILAKVYQAASPWRDLKQYELSRKPHVIRYNYLANLSRVLIFMRNPLFTQIRLPLLKALGRQRFKKIHAQIKPHYLAQ